MTKAATHSTHPDPNPDREQDHFITLRVRIPTHGKPSRDMREAEGIKRALQLSLSGRVEVALLRKEDRKWETVPDQDWRRLA